MLKLVILFLFIALLLGLSQTAGVGGGPIVNMCLMIGIGYHAKLSISVTYVFLIGGSLASAWKNAQRKNASTGKSYVDLNLVLLTIPTMTSGSLFGGVVKNYLSEAAITILFTILLIYLIRDLLQTLHKLSAENNAATMQQLLPTITPTIPQQSPNPTSNIPNKVPLLVKIFVGYYLLTVLVSLMRGGLRYKSLIGVDPCGGVGFGFLFLHLGVSVGVSFLLASKLIQHGQREMEEGEGNGGGQLGGHARIDGETVWYFIAAGFFAGLLGATLAIGGALILIPVWLKFGVDKQVATSSTALLILLGALVAFTIAWFNNTYRTISPLTLLFYLILAFTSAAIVKDILSQITQKYGLKSLVIELLLGVVAVSLAVMLPFEMYKMMGNWDQFFSGGRFC